MIEFYSLLLDRLGLERKSVKYPGSLLSKRTVYINKMLCFFFLLLFSFIGNNEVSAQTILINPATDGGFETGATFAANGWSVSSGTNNPWVIGTVVATAPITGNSAYISNDLGVTNSYLPDNNSNNFFWRDVTVPVGETKIALSFNWNCQGESSWDNWQVFYAPTTVTPVGSNTHPGSGTTNVPSAITGATFIGFGQTTAGVQTANFFLPATLAGTTFRLIFSWKNETGGTQPPASIDNISLMSAVPGNYVSITSGDWNATTTWDSGSVPTSLDNATIATGHTVAINAAGLAAKDVTVNGILNYGTIPSSFAMAGNLTVNTGGLLNVFNGTTGKTISVAGNIVNNGTIDLSVGTTSSGNLTLNGNMLQTLSGSGTFVNGKIRNLTCSNTSTTIPNIDWQMNNLSVEYNLNISNAKINLGTNKFTHGISTTVHTGSGSFTFTDGGFIGGKFSRWWSAGATGYTTSGPASIPTGGAGRYPFYTLNGQQRILYIGRTTPTVGGEYAVVYNNASTVTSGLSIADGAYTITDRWNGSFQVSTEGTTPVAASYWTTIFAPNIYYPLNGVGRVLGQSAAISGTHVNSTAGASAQRSGVAEADLLSATGLYMGINSADLLFASVVSGDWNNPATWNKGIVPTCTDVVTIGVGTNVTVNSAASVVKDLTIVAGGTLTVVSGDLTVGCILKNNLFVNNGTLSVTGGVLNVNGSFIHNGASIFNQSGGAINVDGNDAGAAATSVASGVSIVQLNSNLINWTGGTLTIIDPHANSTASNTFTYSSGTSVDVTVGHTLRFGDGLSTDAGGNTTNGFRLNTWASSGRISFYNLEVNGAAGTNRFVSTTYSYGVNGAFTINTNGEYRDSSTVTYVSGNFSNAGTFINTGTLYLGSLLNGVSGTSVNTQTVSGAGVFANALTESTAGLSSFTVNNTNAAGVTLNIPISLSGTLSLVAGKLNTTAANLLTVGTTSSSASISGGSATAYVNGPLARTIASGNANTNYIVFPVGKTDYTPIAVAPSTTTVGGFKAEAFGSNSGTTDATLNALADKRWQVANLFGTYTDINIRLAEAGIVATSIPVQGSSAAGVYTNAFGSLATYVAGTPNTTQSISPIIAADFTGFISYANSNVCSGTPTPGNLIASETVVCLGTTVSFSLQNQTPGTGVTYVWESSTNGVDFTAIDGATSATFSATPLVETYYRAQVTCGLNTGSTTTVQITFSNSVTASPVSRCGTGTVSLEAVGSAGTTIKWYTAASGGPAIGSGSPFVSPSISTNTTFYAAAETANAGSSALGNGALTSSGVAESFFPGSWGGTKTQYIIKASELMAAGLTAGNITSLGFEPTNSGQTYQGFFVTIGHTANATAPTATFISSGLTQVYAGTEANDGFTPVANTVNTLAFGAGTGSTAVFNWDGTSNIVVSISWSRVPSASTATSSSMKVDNVGFVSSAYRQRDNVTPAAMLAEATVNTTGSVRPRFTINGQVLCSSPRLAVAATVTVPPTLTLSGNPPVICEGQTSSLVTILDGGSAYDTFVWSSPTEVSGDAVNGWIFTPTATKTYTLTASQSGGALCGATATVTVNVNPLPTALTIATPAPVCATTILPLTVTGGNAFGSEAIIGAGTDLTGATSQPTAFCNRWPNYWSQTIYTAAELTAAGLTAGNISSLAYNIATLGDGANNAAFTIKIGTTTDSSFASTTFAATTSFTNVYGPATYTHTASGWQQIMFTTPYAWDGVSNIIINVTHNGADSTNNAQTYYTPTVLNTTLWATSFTGTTTTGTLSLNRLNIKFVPELPVTTSWLPITNLYSDALATVPYVSDANAKTVYFKSATAGPSAYTISSENDGTGCARTTTVDVTVNALPSLIITNPVAVCSPSIVDITTAAVTAGSDAGLTLTYWADPNATVTFPAPEAITSSGTFYIRAVNANSCSVIAPVVVTVNPLPSLVVTGPVAVCSPSTVDLTAAAVTVGSDANLTLTYWADPNATVAFPSPDAIASSGTFYIKAENANGCSVISSVAVVVNVTPAPTGAAAQSFNNTATVADLAATVTGTLQWYDAASAGALLAPGTALVNGGVYYASQTIGGCESTTRFEVTVTLVSTLIDYANLQFPGSATISQGGNFDVYAQVYDAGVTEAAGANAVISAWIGYSSTNENPTAASFTWIPANYNVQSGNNDEYSIALGAALPVGTYYYASRFQVNGGDFAYGGYSGTGGGFWDGTANVNGVLNVQLPMITYANIQFPGTADIVVGGTETIYAQVYAQGVTEGAGAGAGITAWIGYSSTNENPNAASFTWMPASFNTQSGNNDEFSSAIGSGLTAGTYYYASRFQLDGGDFVYGGYSATNGGFWDGTANVNGVLTVNCGVVAAPTTASPTQDFNTGDDLSDFDVTGTNLIWYDAATNGNVLPSTTVVTMGTVYYVSQTVDGCESATRLMVTAGVDLRTPGFDSASLKYYPNPVTDVLTVTYSGTIDAIAIFNVLGQEVYQKTHHDQEVKVDMSSLATGNYIVKIMANGLVKNIKVMKK